MGETQSFSLTASIIFLWFLKTIGSNPSRLHLLKNLAIHAQWTVALHAYGQETILKPCTSLKATL